MNFDNRTARLTHEAEENVPGANDFHIRVDFGKEAIARALKPAATGTRRSPDKSEALASSRTAQILEARSQNAIATAMKTIREMAIQTDLMRQGIPGGSQPRMVKVKFGIQLDIEAGAFIAKSGIGATLEVELEWARRSDDVLRVLRADTDVENALFTPSFRPDFDQY